MSSRGEWWVSTIFRIYLPVAGLAVAIVVAFTSVSGQFMEFARASGQISTLKETIDKIETTLDTTLDEMRRDLKTLKDKVSNIDPNVIELKEKMSSIETEAEACSASRAVVRSTQVGRSAQHRCAEVIQGLFRDSLILTRIPTAEPGGQPPEAIPAIISLVDSSQAPERQEFFLLKSRGAYNLAIVRFDLEIEALSKCLDEYEDLAKTNKNFESEWKDWKPLLTSLSEKMVVLRGLFDQANRY